MSHVDALAQSLGQPGRMSVCIDTVSGMCRSPLQQVDWRVYPSRKCLISFSCVRAVDSPSALETGEERKNLIGPVHVLFKCVHLPHRRTHFPEMLTQASTLACTSIHFGVFI